MKFGEIVKDINVLSEGDHYRIQDSDYGGEYFIEDTAPAEIFFKNEKAIAIKTVEQFYKDETIVVIWFYEEGQVDVRAETGVDINTVKENLNNVIYDLDKMNLFTKEQIEESYIGTLQTLSSVVQAIDETR